MLKFIVFTCLVYTTSTNGLDFDGALYIKLLHNLNCENEGFCHRGTITLRSLRSGTAEIDQRPFTKKDVESLKNLAREDGYYTVQSIVPLQDNKEAAFLSSVKAQSFLENSLTDIISAWVMPTGAVTAITFQVANLSLPLEPNMNSYEVNSNFYLRQIDQAPVPDTASYIQKLVREKEAKEKGEGKDNRSFLAKYWMYIVPIAIFVLISGAANPDGAQTGGR